MEAVLVAALVADNSLREGVGVDLAAGAGRILAPTEVFDVFHVPGNHKVVEPNQSLMNEEEFGI